jgi:hypothetical protein
MPKSGEEIYLTELETEIMSVFVKRKILSDLQIANILTDLANKLGGQQREALD